MVKKRISSRFFLPYQNKFDNPKPGTIVDCEVTRAESYDFFLIAQSVRQGTVTPTHYNVIWDTSGLKPDHIQRLTYKLTHLYYNWPVRIYVPRLPHLSWCTSFSLPLNLFVLSFLGYRESSCAMPICPQIGILGRTVHSQVTITWPGRQVVLSLRKMDLYRQKNIGLWTIPILNPTLTQPGSDKLVFSYQPNIFTYFRTYS